MSVPTFTVVDDFERTESLADALYQIGIENPKTADIACSPYPYPSRDDIVRMLNGDLPIVLAYDNLDGSVAGAVQFVKETGIIKNFINRFYRNEDGSASGKGDELVATLGAAIKERSESGRVVSTSPNPNTLEDSLRLGLEVEP